MFKKFMKIYGVVYSIIIAIVIIFVVIDFGTADSVMDTYEANTGKGKNSFPRQLDFLISYTSATGDFTLMESTGMTKDEAIAAMKQRTGIDPTNPDPDPSGPGSSATPQTWTQSTLQAAVQAYNSSATASNMSVKTSNGISYPGESQNTYWTAGGGGGGSNCHGLGSGCMWFATSVAASMVTGKTIGIEVLLKNVGYTVTTKNGSAYIDPAIEHVGLDSSAKYPNGSSCTPNSIVAGKCNMKEISPGKPSNWFNASFINNGGVYLVHANNDNSHLVSSGGQHWFVVAGSTSEGYIVLNGSGTAASTGLMKTSDVDKFNINHVYEVTK